MGISSQHEHWIRANDVKNIWSVQIFLWVFPHSLSMSIAFVQMVKVLKQSRMQNEQLQKNLGVEWPSQKVKNDQNNFKNVFSTTFLILGMDHPVLLISFFITTHITIQKEILMPKLTY